VKVELLADLSKNLMLTLVVLMKKTWRMNLMVIPIIIFRMLGLVEVVGETIKHPCNLLGREQLLQLVITITARMMMKERNRMMRMGINQPKIVTIELRKTRMKILKMIMKNIKVKRPNLKDI
jgi:hypothetical protein